MEVSWLFIPNQEVKVVFPNIGTDVSVVVVAVAAAKAGARSAANPLNTREDREQEDTVRPTPGLRERPTKLWWQ